MRKKTSNTPLLFQEISAELLKKIFPNGPEDIQLFHPIFPGLN